MEFSLLYAIPRTPALDSLFLAMTKLSGAYGQLWLIVAIVLLIFKRTRRTGISVLIAYVGVLLIGQLLLKHLVSRPRPCQIDQAFALLVSRPTSSSFPSTHTAWSFGAASAIFFRHRKAGIAAFVVAALIAFSRLYLFVHFPTDVLFGIALGLALGCAAEKLSGAVSRRFLKE